METLKQKTQQKYKYMFKSYYVVWKRKNENTCKQSLAKFKSYYVVWKQYQVQAVGAWRESLNRTMQYGNPLSE